MKSLSKKPKKNKVWDADQQRKYIAKLRAESVLDPSIPLGSTPPPLPEDGPTAQEYYRSRAGLGQYWNLNPYCED
jgi:hypothetical protein